MAQVVGDYYAAMNAHVVDRALSFLHPNVLVTFPEQERNWRGVEAAREKFGGMFVRMPGFTGSFEVKGEETRPSPHEGGDGDGADVSTVTTVLTVACRFRCAQTGSDSARDMVYHVCGGLIAEIHHL